MNAMNRVAQALIDHKDRIAALEAENAAMRFKADGFDQFMEIIRSMGETNDPDPKVGALLDRIDECKKLRAENAALRKVCEAAEAMRDVLDAHRIENEECYQRINDTELEQVKAIYDAARAAAGLDK